jgi:hypothetical protein
VAADPLPEPVPPRGLLAARVVLGDLRALHERRQGLAARAEAAGVGDELFRRVRGELLGRRRLGLRRGRLAGAREQRLPPRPRRGEAPHHLPLERRKEPLPPLLLHLLPDPERGGDWLALAARRDLHQARSGVQAGWGGGGRS